MTEHGSSDTNAPPPRHLRTPDPQPWWRRTPGILTVAVLAVLVLLAGIVVVGLLPDDDDERAVTSGPSATTSVSERVKALQREQEEKRDRRETTTLPPEDTTEAGETTDSAPETTTTVPPETTTTAPPEPPTTAAPAEVSGLAATAKADAIDIFGSPDATGPDRTLTAGEAVSVPGSIPITFLVKAVAENRLEVYLPVRPNGSSGWVDEADVDVVPVNHRVEVALSEYRIRVYHREEVVLDEPIGIGRQDRPTPGGIYYIKELLQPPDPNGVYGSYAYGLSGFSEVLESFAGGEGVLGIHGTNDPSSIGGDVSSGCIRLTNEAVERLVHDIGLPLGTPVDIQA